MDRRPLPGWLGLLVGVLSAAVGLAPWLVTGLRLPLQNLWDGDPGPAGMPRALLPFSQYYLVLTSSLLVTGAAIAGLSVRAVRHRAARSAVLAVIGGVLVTHIVALVQTAVVVHRGLQPGRAATLYFTAVLAAAVVSLLTALLVAVLISRRTRVPAVIGLCVAAVMFTGWVAAFVYPVGSIASGENRFSLLLPWIAPVLVGVAIGWGGVASIGRTLAALVGLVLLWVLPAAITAVENAAGSRVLARRPAEMADYAVAVFRAALTQPELVVRSLVCAVVVAAITLVIRRIARLRPGRTG